MNVRRTALPLLLVALAGTGELGAEISPADWFHAAWQTEDGLSDNSVSGLAQSPDGYLWVATKGGLMRFNGAEFTPLPLRELPELPSHAIRAMFLDRRGQLWLGMERGPLIRLGEDSFRTFGVEDGILPQRIISMTDDPVGRVWVGYATHVCLVESNTVTRFDASAGIPPGDHASLACDAAGQVWYANGGQVGRLTRSGFETVHRFGKSRLHVAAAGGGGLWLAADSALMRVAPDAAPDPVAQLPAGTAVNAIYEDRGGAVWIGTFPDGLFRFHDGILQSVSTSHNGVDCITQDREGNIWAGTSGGGLNQVRPRAVQLIGEDRGLPFSSVRSIACDRSGRMWAASWSGRLVYREADRWVPSPVAGDSADHEVTCVAADASGRVWVGMRQHGLLCIDGDDRRWFEVQDGLSSMFVRSILAARSGDVWIATDGTNRLHRLRDGTITPLSHTGEFNAVRALAEGADGTIWAGTSDGRILRVAGGSLVDEGSIVEPFPLSVRSLHATPDGSLWIGYAGHGLGHLRKGRYSRLTTDHGLHDDYISQILDDGEGSLWMAANRGLFQVDLEELRSVSEGRSERLRSRVFGRSDGLPSLQPSRDYFPAACRGPDEHLYFAMRNGILEVRPDKIRDNRLPPPVVLERVTLDDKVIGVYHARSVLNTERAAEQTNLSTPNPRLRIPPGHGKLEIRFAALSLTSSENVHFRYRLRPFDRTWVEADNRRSAIFPRLPAGAYEFQVIACNNVGVWNESGATLDITVEPFFWETWWFRIGGGLATALGAGGIVFLSLRWRHKRQLRRLAARQALEQERSRIARDIHDDLGASLTRITLLSQSSPAGPEQADTVLEHIHDTARHLMRSMEEVVWAVNPEHDTFDALANYISNYGQGFLGIADVRCRLEMPLVLPQKTLSAQVRHNLFLAYKEALNNAVKHAGASEVRISLQPGDNGFVLKVEDNGRGTGPHAPADPRRPGAGRGLANMASRMEEIGGTCRLLSTAGKGTTVQFEVPFQVNP